MPEQETLRRARRDKREGKAASTQAGEFIREEMHHIREGKHGAQSTKQAIAIGLSKARRAGVGLAPPKSASTSSETRRRAQRDYAVGHGAPARARATPKRSRAGENALKRAGGAAAGRRALSSQARRAAKARSPAQRSAAASRAARTRAGRLNHRAQ
jgi:hypothetical protein